MRRMLLALCAVLLLAVSCPLASPQGGEAYELYFQAADLRTASGGDALRAETVYLEGTEDHGTLALMEELLTLLLEGPESAHLTSPIPAGTSLLSLELEGSWAKVDLSTPYRSLSGVALTLADYAITLTLTQLPEVSAVSVTVRGQPLGYRDVYLFKARDVLFSSNDDVIGTLPVTLYFLDEGGNLVPRERTLDLYEGDTQVGAVVKALMEGPEDRELHTAFPEGFQVASVRQEEGTCYVDLPSGALQEIPEEADLAPALRALSDSLLSVSGVLEVRFLVDGDLAAAYGPAILSEPYIP